MKISSLAQARTTDSLVQQTAASSTASESSSSDTDATSSASEVKTPTPAASDPAAAAASAPKVSSVTEIFQIESGSLEEHVAKHDFPQNVATCGPCRFWKHRRAWSVACS